MCEPGTLAGANWLESGVLVNETFGVAFAVCQCRLGGVLLYRIMCACRHAQAFPSLPPLEYIFAAPKLAAGFNGVVFLQFQEFKKSCDSHTV